ncbi:MAG: tRNA adenosine(34) deaminase TadA [Proteobacteria bacterium]|nr:tRNA adenosine(34) deaminase TadA [Pseudomonadota bacterium]
MENIAPAPSEADDARWMAVALAQAREAAAAGEVPVGAVVVKDGVLLATGRNSPVATHDPTAHAEVNALRAAAAALGNYRLDGCTLYVTLEPCAMCSGAMLHARLARVVYGAADPRTGAAGSVVDLFAQPLLNHHTRVTSGVAAEACGALLQDFFRGRRQAARETAQPLRDDALRTPEACFDPWREALPPVATVADLPSLAGWRMAYIDTRPGPSEAPVLLALHGWGEWGFLYRHLWPLLPGWRVLAPDLIGFGRSDKPKRGSIHAPAWHAQVLLEWLQQLGVRQLAIVHHPDGGPLVQVLRQNGSPRVTAAWAIDIGHADADTQRAWQAPFPDRGHEAAPRALGARGVSKDDLDPATAARLAARLVRAGSDPMGYSGA